MGAAGLEREVVGSRAGSLAELQWECQSGKHLDCATPLKLAVAVAWSQPPATPSLERGHFVCQALGVALASPAQPSPGLQHRCPQGIADSPENLHSICL